MGSQVQSSPCKVVESAAPALSWRVSTLVVPGEGAVADRLRLAPIVRSLGLLLALIIALLITAGCGPPL
jgi:hypothetical protein